MDVQTTRRERVFSILNDNDCPSFVIKQKRASPSLPTQKLPSISELTAFSPRPERPSLFRAPQFQRNNSISSAGSPPLLRYDSSSSAKSSSSMDSTPSPITPAYNYTENGLSSYDSMLRQDPSLNYLPSPTGITPFIDQAMMLGPVPVAPEQFMSKPAPQPLAPAGYPQMPIPVDMNQMPTPALSANNSISSASSAPQPHPMANAATQQQQQPKKNKYPCPYAQSHNCSATFTTSGHAARHGKKHTGEKGVHCPICNKAFTRKDNMKQHERTHKNKPAKEDEKKSKAQATRDANKQKDEETVEDAPPVQIQPLPTHISQAQATVAPSAPQHPAHMRKSSSGHSEPSDSTLNAISVNTPISISPPFFSETTPQIMLSGDTTLTEPMSMYPALPEDIMTATAPATAAAQLEMSSNDKLEVPQPPALIRGFSDLDTLAQAAETFDPYFQQNQF